MLQCDDFHGAGCVAQEPGSSGYHAFKGCYRATCSPREPTSNVGKELVHEIALRGQTSVQLFGYRAGRVADRRGSNKFLEKI